MDDLEIDATAVLLEQRLVAQAVAEMGFWALVSVEGDIGGLDKDNQAGGDCRFQTLSNFIHILSDPKTGHKML